VTNVNRATLAATALVALVVGGSIAWWGKSSPKSPVEPPSLNTIENMGHLVTVRVHSSDIIDFTLPRAVDVPMTDYEIRYGGTTILLIAKRDCSLASDLRLAKYESTDTERRHVTLVLPSPKAPSPRVNHGSPENGGSRLYRIENNALEALIPDQSNRTQAIDKAYAKAEARVTAASASADLIQLAKKNTEVLLEGVYEGAGWSVTSKWR